MVSKKKLIELLSERGLYEATDDTLIDEFVTNQKIMNQAKKDINSRGIMVAINKEGTLFNTNPSVSIYNGALKNILALAKRFGLSPRDRAELKLEGASNEDTFGE